MTDDQIDRIIDAVRNALGGMMPRSTSYAEHREQAARGIRAVLAQHPSQSDYEAVLADHKRLVRELDVLLNGEDGAAQQAFLADLVAQVRRQGIRAALPSQSAGEPEGVTCLRCGFVTYIQEGESPGHTTHRMQMERYRKAGLALEEPSPPPADAARVAQWDVTAQWKDT